MATSSEDLTSLICDCGSYQAPGSLLVGSAHVCTNCGIMYAVASHGGGRYWQYVNGSNPGLLVLKVPQLDGGPRCRVCGAGDVLSCTCRYRPTSQPKAISSGLLNEMQATANAEIENLRTALARTQAERDDFKLRFEGQKQETARLEMRYGSRINGHYFPASEVHRREAELKAELERWTNNYDGQCAITDRAIAERDELRTSLDETVRFLAEIERLKQGGS